MEERTVKDTTHLLLCHYGKCKKPYYMNCIPERETENGFLKVIVFGDRRNSRRHKYYTKYVKKERVLPKQQFLFNQ